MRNGEITPVTSVALSRDGRMITSAADEFRGALLGLQVGRTSA